MINGTCDWPLRTRRGRPAAIINAFCFCCLGSMVRRWRGFHTLRLDPLGTSLVCNSFLSCRCTMVYMWRYTKRGVRVRGVRGIGERLEKTRGWESWRNGGLLSADAAGRRSLGWDSWGPMRRNCRGALIGNVSFFNGRAGGTHAWDPNRYHREDTDYKLHSICNEVHLFWRPLILYHQCFRIGNRGIICVYVYGVPFGMCEFLWHHALLGSWCGSARFQYDNLGGIIIVSFGNGTGPSLNRYLLSVTYYPLYGGSKLEWKTDGPRHKSWADGVALCTDSVNLWPSWFGILFFGGALVKKSSSRFQIHIPD